MKIAMWSGPRNISTAMMRSWGNRPDCYVCDEPLYAHYLTVTGLPHPGAEETLASQETDWREVVRWLTGKIPEGKSIFYQKQMAHHLLPNIEPGWLDQLQNCFLIRKPADMLTSLLEFIPQPTVQDTGLPQQEMIFNRVLQRTGQTPPVLDARDVLLNPEAMLSKLCQQLSIPFRDEMLSWPPGLRSTDGAWASHWYAKVEPTTGFAEYRPKSEPVPEGLEGVLQQCNDIYDRLHKKRIR